MGRWHPDHVRKTDPETDDVCFKVRLATLLTTLTALVIGPSGIPRQDVSMSLLQKMYCVLGLT